MEKTKSTVPEVREDGTAQGATSDVPKSVTLKRLETDDGFFVEVGHDPSEVGRYLADSLSRQYDELQERGFGTDEVHAQLLHKMMHYYYTIGNQACMEAVERKAEELVAMRKMKERFDGRLGRLQAQPEGGRERRPRVVYRDDVESCFRVEDPTRIENVEGPTRLENVKDSTRLENVKGPTRLENVKACIDATCREIAREFKLETNLVADMSRLLCGEVRSVVLRGHKDRCRELVALMVRMYVRERPICVPAAGLATCWEAAGQAFLRAYRQPYAADHFSKARLDTPEAHRMKEIILRQLKEHGLA